MGYTHVGRSAISSLRQVDLCRELETRKRINGFFSVAVCIVCTIEDPSKKLYHEGGCAGFTAYARSRVHLLVMQNASLRSQEAHVDRTSSTVRVTPLKFMFWLRSLSKLLYPRQEQRLYILKMSVRSTTMFRPLQWRPAAPL